MVEKKNAEKPVTELAETPDVPEPDAPDVPEPDAIDDLLALDAELKDRGTSLRAVLTKLVAQQTGIKVR